MADLCPVCGLPYPDDAPSAGPDGPLLPGEPTVCLLDHGGRRRPYRDSDEFWSGFTVGCIVASSIIAAVYALQTGGIW